MIRKINGEQKEIDDVMNIWLDSTVKAHSFIEKDYWSDSYETVKNVYLPQSETFVYIEEEHIVGFISIINKDYVGALFIDVNQQSKGIGRQLIEYAKEHYHDLKLAVYKDNDQAVRFYQSNGFVKISEQLNEETNKPEYIMNYSD